ncbi:hypothetical protein DPMN_030393 [Dreissena polymorpha]|uniref:Uncharacterized protein n=1 Tax=Dreissena polymorpha TaxID=45954 RepID=A0A9D4M112_DREPO|nr:hypothetical protein DPMN_030393 [Dreissena polymorpha]
MQERDNSMTTIRQCDNDSATIRWRHGEERAIFRSDKVHHRSTNAKSKFGTARRKFVDVRSSSRIRTSSDCNKLLIEGEEREEGETELCGSESGY